MLRFITPLIVVALAIAAAPAGAVGKSPGAYANVAVRDAAACARLCADDGLCMAWTLYSGGACELTAVVPAEAPADSAGFGLASRALAFAARPVAVAQLTPITTPAPVSAPAPSAPVPAPVAAAPAPQQLLDVGPDFESEDTTALLGGPEEGDLRLTVGSQQ